MLLAQGISALEKIPAAHARTALAASIACARVVSAVSANGTKCGEEVSYWGCAMKDDLVLCTQCEEEVDQQLIGTPSLVVTLLLLLFFIVPGILYWLYCEHGSYWGCPRCHSSKIVPLNSAAAARIKRMQAASQ
jgi:hypothetical protein